MKYMYGIVRADAAPNIDITGMDDAPLKTVSDDRFTAVVSDTEMKAYEQTRRHMTTHTRVLERLMADGRDVLPIRFNTVAPDETAVREQLLAARGNELERLMRQIHGRVELGLKAYWYQEKLFADILAAHDDIRKLRDSLMGKSEAETYYDRIQLGEMIEAAVEEKRETERDQILQALTPLAEKHRTSHIGTERMVVNASFLVPRHRETDFDAAVNDLDDKFGERMKFKYVGPVPPYNFVDLVIEWT